ncbi:hypothetical protein ENSA5_07580 [Enhygromyxa salina]|uniref:Uncharacterized protein n=1 Tax=Enhygromyxa salina TaxID=215803 RepID=A0A2S9YHB7_9BACT|nr:hypothetical protein ENSA5_07580 [Enhygromyxa salina]
MFGDQSAWLVCCQLARNPSFSIASELVGLLGTEAELAQLRQAFDAAPTPELLWALGLSGRRVGLDACVEHFDDDDDLTREAAREGLSVAAGRGFASVSEAKSWLEQRGASRSLGGAERGPAQVLAVLAEAPDRLRRALARELRIRSRGRVHLDPGALPHAWRSQLDAPLSIDFDRGFPWTDAELGDGP